MKYKAITTFQHNGGLYVAGDEVPCDERWGDLLVKLGKVSRETKQLKAAPAANKKGGYNRRDISKTETK